MDDSADETSVRERLAAWVRPTWAELVGLAVLCVGALVASGLWFLEASQRPSEISNEAAAVGDELAHGTGSASEWTTDGDRAARRAHPESSAPPGGTDPGADVEPAGVTDGPVLVHLTGAIRSPGVVELVSGDRVRDAVAAAGGLTEQAVVEQINLARILVDGEHVHVPREGEEPIVPTEPGSAGVSAAVGATAADGTLDINRATPEELERLPGIGPARAEAIVAHRREHGPFETPGDLRAVSGIGEVTFQRLADLVAVP